MEEKEPKIHVKEFFELLQQYLSKRLDLLRLEGIDILTRVFSTLIVYLILAIFFFLILTLLSILGGLFFSSVFHSHLAGFGLIVIFYLIIFIVIYVSRKSLVEKFFAPQFLKMIFNNDEDEN